LGLGLTKEGQSWTTILSLRKIKTDEKIKQSNREVPEIKRTKKIEDVRYDHLFFLEERSL
jgi:ribosomal protein L39E